MITGAGTSTVTEPTFKDCSFGTSTIPPSSFAHCGFGLSAGVFTSGSNGEYHFNDCFSLVAGVGTPSFDFTGISGASGIHNRRWAGGATYTLSSFCTLSHEVLAGGLTSITTGGADVEVRGITKALTVVMSAAEMVRFVGITGDITLSGTTTATVEIFGVYGTLTDTTTAATVTVNAVSQGSIDARTILAAAYFDPAVDAVANVTLVATTTTNTDMVGTDSAALATALATAQLDLDTLTGADGALIATGAITTAAIATGAIDADAIAANALTAAKIATDAITAAKIAADAIGASELAASAVTEIQSGLATSAALVTHDGKLDTAQTDLDTLTGVDGALIATGAVTAAAIATNAIDADSLAADAVTEIQSGLATSAALATVQTDLDTITGVDGTTLASAQGNYAPAIPSEVNTEVVDVMRVDTLTEISSDTGATPTMEEVLMLIYQWIKNDNETTATTRNVKNNAGATVLTTAAVGDDGTTGNQGKLG